MALLVALPAFAGYAGLGWEMSQVAGLLAALACIALCGLPIRPRESVPVTFLSLRLHTLVGWIAVAAVVIHVAGLLLVDPVVVEYLKPSMPLYAWAGALGSLLLVAVVLGSGTRTRRRIWSSHRGFQATHVILGGLLIALVAIHVVTTDRYTGGFGRRAWWLVATGGAILLLLRMRPRARPTADAPAQRRQLVFGRHSRLVFLVLAGLAVVLSGLLAGSVSRAMRQPIVRPVGAIPLDFPHTLHVEVNCLTCHHNFADGKGFDNCIACHKSARADLKVEVEARFHGFCLECHRQPTAHFKKRGPVSGCVACHRHPVVAAAGIAQ